MAKRKTVKIAELKAHANKVFRESQPEFSEGRKHIATFVEDLLHASGQYKGFNYLEAKDLQDGWKPGIVFDESPARDHVFPDPTRIYYY